MKYVDVKITVWERYHFNETSQLNKVIEELEKTSDIDDILDPNLGYSHMELISDTRESLSVEDNQDNPTIEVYMDDSVIWDNKDK
jgi:hypothetical protein